MSQEAPKAAPDILLNDGRPQIDGQIHPFEYYYKPGMKLRPAPARTKSSPAWKPVRERLLSPLMHVDHEPRRTELVQKLEDHFWQGDELMDAVIDLGHRIGLVAVRKMVTTALSSGIESLSNPPPEILALFSQLDSVPAWFTPEEFEHGRVVFSNASWFGSISSLIINKAITAQAEPVASAVGATGQYTSKTTKAQIRRHLETTHFFARVPRPGGWKRYSETFQEIVKVRFMHCQVRYLLKKTWGKDHFERSGMPISSTDMAHGLVAFGVQRHICDGVFGIRYATADLDAVVRFWGYIGYIFGVAEEIIPRDFDDAVTIVDFLLSSDGTPSPYGPDIVKSFDTFGRELRGEGKTLLGRFANRLNQRFIHGLTYFILGDVLGPRQVATANYSKPYLRLLSFASAVVAKLAICIMALKGCLPGRAGRMQERARLGDPFEEYVESLSGELMKKYELKATFEAHDAHSVGDFREN